MRTAPRSEGLPTPPKDIGRASERSDLFWAMYENHDGLERMWRRRRIDWVKFCAWAAANGWLTKAGVPIPNTAKSTWQRVRLLKRQERAERKQAQRASLHPTPPARKYRVAAEVAPAAEQARSRPPMEQPEPLPIDREVDEQMAGLRKTINKRVGRPTGTGERT